MYGVITPSCLDMQVRLGTYINAPPAACVAARAAQDDPRAEPAFGERVPYVVVCGAPSAHNLVAAIKPVSARLGVCVPAGCLHEGTGQAVILTTGSKNSEFVFFGVSLLALRHCAPQARRLMAVLAAPGVLRQNRIEPHDSR